MAGRGDRGEKIEVNSFTFHSRRSSSSPLCFRGHCSKLKGISWWRCWHDGAFSQENGKSEFGNGRRIVQGWPVLKFTEKFYKFGRMSSEFLYVFFSTATQSTIRRIILAVIFCKKFSKIHKEEYPFSTRVQHIFSTKNPLIRTTLPSN